jgi:hypothetical protein
VESDFPILFLHFLMLAKIGLVAESLGWESRRHVGNMSARQPKNGTFGRLGQVVLTQFRSRHFFCVGICRLSPNFL